MKKKIILMLAMLTFLMAGLTACGEKVPENAWAKVGDEYVMEEDVNADLDTYMKMYGFTDEDSKNSPEAQTFRNQLKPRVVQMLINERIINKVLKDENIEVTDDDVNTDFEAFKGQYKTEEEYKKQLEESGLTEEEVKKELRKNLPFKKFEEFVKKNYTITKEEAEKLIQEEKVLHLKASHILVQTEEEAKAIEEKLKNGEDFGKLAKEKSIDPSAQNNNGELGYFKKGDMVEEFYDAAEKLKEGEISQPVKTQYGYHIIRLEKRAEGLDGMEDEMKDSIIEQKIQEVRSEKTKERTDKAQKELGVVVYEEKFNQQPEEPKQEKQENSDAEQKPAEQDEKK